MIPCDGCGKPATRRAFLFGPTIFLCDECEPTR